MKINNVFMNPYLAGVLLGLVLILSFYISGRGLGASGAVKSIVITSVNLIAPSHTEEAEFYKDYLEEHPDSPLKAWLVFLLAGVILGGFTSGLRSNRVAFQLEHGPNIKPVTRIIFALLGGILFGFGSQMGRGCTSGAALSGMAVLSTAGFITMLAIFGTAFIFAYFFRKLWI